MARQVEQALADCEYLIIEAGTGTGKTLAYLVSAIESGRRIVISTATKNLQEQIYFKDMPVLQRMGFKFEAVFMKGRANYLCKRRLRRFLTQPYFDAVDQARFFETILQWSERTDTGDRSELRDLPDDYPAWNEICSSAQHCAGAKCEFNEGCFLARLRARAAAADIVVVNHHLFFADLAVRESGMAEVIPRYEAVVFDEAHQIESVASGFFGIQVSNLRVEDLIRDARAVSASLKEADAVKLKNVFDGLFRASSAFFQAFDRGTGSESRRRLRGRQTLPPDVDELLDGLCLALGRTKDAFTALASQTGDTDAEAVARRAWEIEEQAREIVLGEEPGKVYWCESRGRGIFLSATPIDVAKELGDRLFPNLDTAVFTSATLSTDNNFSFFKSRVGIERECIEEVLPTCFDFGKQALLYLPRGLPDPNAANFADRAAEEIRRLIEASSGRAMVLFTSYRNMERVYEILKGKIDYRMMIQGEKPKSVLTEEFRSDVHSVLFATASFWEGVDVQGEALSCVIIDKLPFASPQDPVVEARIEAIEGRGDNPFLDYQVPHAIITLKQGLGRLIRNRKDRGVLSILDGRLLTRSYGEIIMRSLPRFRITRSIKDVDAFFAHKQRGEP